MAVTTDPAALDRDLQIGAATYRVRVRSTEHGWDELARELAELDADRFVILAGGTVPPALLARVPGQVLEAPALSGLQTVERLAEQLLLGGATRRTVLLAVGGGTACGLGGLLAGLLFQGLRLVQVPTTLAAMCGSAMSLRHNVPSGVLGAYHAPELVWSQLDVLQASEELRADLSEPIRHVLAICPAHYDRLAAVLNPEARYTPRELASFVALGADARANVSCYDPLERGPARVLDYGRAIGRAVRLLAGGALRRGDADGLGMLAAARVAGQLGVLGPADERAHRELLVRNGSPVALPAGVDPESLPAAVRLVAARGGEPGLVLLSALGQPYCANGSLLTQVDDGVVRAALEPARPGGVPHTRSAQVLAPVEP